MPFVAGDDDETCARYTVEIPGDDNSVLAFSGALAELAKAHNWEALGTWTATALAEVFRVALSNCEWTACENGEGDEMSFAVINCEFSSGVSGGTFTSGADRTRTLNAIQSDEDEIVSIASNQFTLQAGTYFVLARAACNKVDENTLSLWNVTDEQTEIIGDSWDADNSAPVANWAFLGGGMVLDGEKTFSLEHRCTTTQATNGMGLPHGFGTEIYVQVLILKVA